MSRPATGDDLALGNDEDLEDLQKRLHLLEGERKAIYETSNFTIRQNKDTLAQLLKEQKELRAQVQGTTKQLAGTPTKPKQDELNEAVKLRRRLDQLKSGCTLKKRELQRLQDKLKEMSAEQKGSLTSEDAPLMRQIRILENRLDKAMIKYNEAQSIGKTYEQIVKRLKEERVGYDNQLAAIERSLKGKEHDFEELLLLSHDANHAKETSEAELRRYEAQITVERMMREKEVQEKKQAVQSRVEMTQRIEQDERKRAGAEAQEANRFLSKVSNSIANEAITQQKLEEEKQKIIDYEDAFRRIKEATGVSDVNEVIQKFTTQEDTASNLEELRKEHQIRIEQLNQQRKELRKHLDSLKYSAGETMSRKQIDEVDNNVGLAQQKYEKCKAKYERLSQIVINIKAGVEHLSERLENIRIDNQTNIPITEENILECLEQCNNKLNHVYSDVKSSDVFALFQLDKAKISKAEDTAFRAATVLQAVSSHPQLSAMAGILDPGSAYNCRVKTAGKDEDEFSEEGIEDELEADFSERDKVRRESSSRNERSAKTTSKQKRVKSAAVGRRGV